MRARPSHRDVKRALSDLRLLWSRPPDKETPSRSGRIGLGARGFTAGVDEKSNASTQRTQAHREWVDEYEAEERRLEREGFLR